MAQRDFTEEEKKYLESINVPAEKKYKAVLGVCGRNYKQVGNIKGSPREMKPHQKILTQAMIDREKRIVKPIFPNGEGEKFSFHDEKMGIIMNEAGTGKTDPIINLILHTPSLSRKRYNFTNNFLSSAYTTNSQSAHLFTKFEFNWNTIEEKGDLNWIVVPHGIFHQWKALLKKSSLTVIYVASAKELENLETKICNQVWLISSTRYKDVCKTWYSINQSNRPMLSRCIFDECDSITIPSCQRVPAVWYWFISSSIQNIYHPVSSRRNNYSGARGTGFIKDTLIAASSNLDNIIINVDYRFVKECLQLPQPKINIVLVKKDIISQTLNGLVNSDVQSMMNAGDFKSVALHYDIEYVDSPTVFIERIIDSMGQKIIGYKNSSSVDKMNHNIRVIKERLDNQKECGICLRETEDNDDPIERPTITPCCYKIWCFECIMKSLGARKKCPLCKSMVDPAELVIIGAKENSSDKQQKSEEKQREYDNKLDAFFDTLRSFKGIHRVLCFSEYDGKFEAIVEGCKRIGIEAKELKGHPATTKKRIREWEGSNKTSVLLLNAKRYGAGLNLQAGTDIFMWHHLSSKVKGESDLERQVIARVVRCGLDHVPTVWKLAHKGEFNEE